MNLILNEKLKYILKKKIIPSVYCWHVDACFVKKKKRHCTHNKPVNPVGPADHVHELMTITDSAIR